jgi:succinate dehydrogenase / fumarate reductase cytochrome b subunit
MNVIIRMLNSSIGKKFLMSLSGLALVGFVFTHLLGNLLLYKNDPTLFNSYAQKLESFGVLLYVAELGLIVLFVMHVSTAVRLKLGYKSARPEGYSVSKSKGGESRKNTASMSMIVSGLVLLFFLVLHVNHFKFGPSIAQGYSTVINGANARDLYRLVFETFKNPIYVLSYVSVMLFLGLHIRHGFWSAFQSSGLMTSKLATPLYRLSLVLGVLFAAGFLFIPIWIYFDLGSKV